MEAVGAGANVLAFVTLALATAKNTYTVLDSVRGGPKNVKETADALLKLVNILDQLSKCPAALADSSLQDDARRSIEDLDNFGDKLMRLQATPGEAASSRLWKRFHSFLKEKDLESVKAVIASHYDRFNIRLSRFTSTTALQTKEGIEKVHQISSQTHTTVEAIERRLESVEAAMEARDSSSIPGSEAAKIQGLLSAIMGQLQISVPKYRNLQSGIIGEVEGDQSIPVEPSEPVASNDVYSQMVRKRLGASLGRLSLLMMEKEQTHQAFDENEQNCASIIEDLGLVLVAIVNEVEALSSDSSLCTPCWSSMNSTAVGLKAFNKRFANDILVVNAKRPKTLSQAQARQLVTTRSSESDFTRVKLESGLLTLSRKLTTWECNCAGPNCEVCAMPCNSARSDSGAARYTEHKTTVTFMTSKLQQPVMLNATNVIQRLRNSYSRSISHLAINRVLPYGSLVFQLVEQGKLQELREGLQRGEFTLRDHDEHGHSLLYYSTRQPEVCKYLIDEELDVNHLTPLVSANRSHLITPLSYISVGHESSQPELYAMRDCRRLLLGAGADPLFGTHAVFISYPLLANLTIMGDACDILETSRQAILNSAITLHDILNYRSSITGLSLLHFSCYNLDKGTRASIISAILKLGLDVNVVDSLGMTGLHTLLVRLGYLGGVGTWQIREQEAVVTLLELGADPYMSILGKEVNAFDIAYFGCGMDTCCASPLSMRESLGSYREDLWDSCLSLRGYKSQEIATIRRKRLRRAAYTEAYTREIFESLWKGREDLCPYWDDEPWPQLPAGSSDEEGNETNDQNWICGWCEKKLERSGTES